MNNLLKLIIIFFIISSLLIFPACRNESVSEETISTIESTEELTQKTINENSIKEPEEKPAEEVVVDEPVEEPELNISLKIVELAKSQISKLTGDGPFASLIWADSNYTYCDRFVSAVMAIACGKPLSERKSYPTAYDDYIAHEGLIKSGEPPKGAVVYYGKHKENWNCGHVGISDGEGNIISVVNRTKGVDITPFNYFRAPLLGWVTFKEYKSQEEVTEEATDEPKEEALDESEEEEILEEEKEGFSSCIILDEEYCNKGEIIYDKDTYLGYDSGFIGLGFTLPEGTKIYSPFKGLADEVGVIFFGGSGLYGFEILDASDPEWGWKHQRDYLFVGGGVRKIIEMKPMFTENPVEKGQAIAEVTKNQKIITPDGKEYDIAIAFMHYDADSNIWSYNEELLNKFFHYR